MLLVAGLLVPGGPASATDPGSRSTTTLRVDPALEAAAREFGAVRVIVGGQFDAAVRRGGAARAARFDAAAVRRSTARTGGQFRWRFRNVPAAVLDATPATLRALASSSGVAWVRPDTIARFTLDDRAELVEADRMIADGFGGAGQVIAIVDSGVHANHKRLRGRQVGEACFASGFYTLPSQGDCPNGLTTDLGAGSGTPCTISRCSHGTNVAAVALSTTITTFDRDGPTGIDSGIAPAARYVSIRVASAEHDQEACGDEPAPCSAPRMSDVARALDHLVDHQVYGNRRLAAVNLSLGRGAFVGRCDDEEPVMTQLIGQLTADGVAVVAASGNSGLGA